MPPKRARIRGMDAVAVADVKTNPRVILRPLRADSSGHTRYRYTHVPPVANLYNQPEFSDIKLKVGDHSYYAHKLVLCAASEVFARMMEPCWSESTKTELVLEEDEECLKVFDRFLYFLYAGNIVISENYVISLFILADKYNVTSLYDECVKVIENGLKVYMVMRSSATSVGNTPRVLKPGQPSTSFGASFVLQSTSSSSYTESSDSDSSDEEMKMQQLPPHSPSTSKGVSSILSHSTSPLLAQKRTHLVASETFPLSLVIKMLIYCHEERISGAALYNLEARLGNQLQHNNYCVWNDLEKDLLLRMLSDTYFYCDEFALYRAAKSWLMYKKERRNNETLAEVLTCIRFAILPSHCLYEVERDEIITLCPEATELVQKAIRYKLFHNCPNAAHEEWTGSQFEARQFKDK